MTSLALTVDVEDFFEGVGVLGIPLGPPIPPGSGLRDLLARIPSRPGPGVGLTLFVVAGFAPRVTDAIQAHLARGDELASHGPDHGRLPTTPAALVEWMRRGRLALEDRFSVPVLGFRAPRFEVPEGMPLTAYRDCVAAAGFRYTSDTRCLGAAAPVVEFPVHRHRGWQAGGGSYQRLVPGWLVRRWVAAGARPIVCYYHSYDFGREVPPFTRARTPRGLAQVLLRRAAGDRMEDLMRHLGSRPLREFLPA